MADKNEPSEKNKPKALVIHSVVDSALWKDEKHSHFWVEDGELYESYNTIRGLRYRHRHSVNGVADCDNCPLDMLLYIVKEYSESEAITSVKDLLSYIPK